MKKKVWKMRFRHLPEAVASMVVTLIFLLFFGSVLKTEVQKLYDDDENFNKKLPRLMENILRKKFYANDINYDRM